MGNCKQPGRYDNGIPYTVYGGNLPLLQYEKPPRLYLQNEQQQQIPVAVICGKPYLHSGRYQRTIPACGIQI